MTTDRAMKNIQEDRGARVLESDPVQAAMKLLEAAILAKSGVAAPNAELIAVRAVQLYAESHPRPSQVTQEQAAEMLGISRATVSRMVKFGTLKLNKVGRIPISQIDKALSAD